VYFATKNYSFNNLIIDMIHDRHRKIISKKWVNYEIHMST